MDERVIMCSQEASKRANNFKEVSLGFTEEEALREANRCLNCPNPRCVKGCPVNVQIPNFIQAIKEGDLDKAYAIINASSTLPAICGRVCPQEKQCEQMCIKGFKGEAISIGALERYVADYHLKHSKRKTERIESNGKKIAIVGSGPSGLTCAGELHNLGYEVTIYETLHKAGGVLTYGIPEFRLPAEIVEKEIANLEASGVKFILNAPIGTSKTLNDLSETFDAVYVATGAGLPKYMGIENEFANGVFSANEILTRINLMGAFEENAKTPIKKAHNAIVVGGGNVAMDAARSLKRLGIDVTLMYRRSIEELPARKVEVEHAMEEGIEFCLLTNPVKICVDDDLNVTGIEAVKMELLEEKDGNRRNVQELPNSNYQIDCDMVVMAIGTNPNPLVLKNSDLKTEKGLIVVEDTKTSMENVFAGGDAVTGSATVILAMEAGKKGAKAIHEYLEQ